MKSPAAIRVVAPVANVAYPAKIQAPVLPANPPLLGKVPQTNAAQIIAFYHATVSSINTAYNQYLDAYSNNAVQYQMTDDQVHKNELLREAILLGTTFNAAYVKAVQAYNALASMNGYAPIQLNGPYPAAASPNTAPVTAPTTMPVGATVMAPTTMPVGAPVMAPTTITLDAPMMALTTAPMMAPTTAPMMAPTKMPAGAPVMLPVAYNAI